MDRDEALESLLEEIRLQGLTTEQKQHKLECGRGDEGWIASHAQKAVIDESGCIATVRAGRRDGAEVAFSYYAHPE